MKHADRILRHAKALDRALQEQTNIEQGLYPVVLYFGSDEDREGFLAVAREACPGMTAHKLEPKAEPFPKS